MMQNSGGGAPYNDIFKRIPQLIDIRYAIVEIFSQVGLDQRP
jgi:hypothetical protein